MTRPTVDQIAAVLRNGETNKRTHLHIAAEIAALWAEEEVPRTQFTLATALNMWLGNGDARPVADAIDARIDAKMGAGRVTDITHPSPFYGAIRGLLDELSPGWDKSLDVTLDALIAIRALHARAEAAEAKRDHFKSVAERAAKVCERALDIIESLMPLVSLSDTPTGAARE